MERFGYTPAFTAREFGLEIKFQVAAGSSAKETLLHGSGRTGRDFAQ